MAKFELLQQRLMLRELDELASGEAHIRIIEEARIAGQLAVDSGFPALVFPVLFEERVAVALRALQSEEASFWESLRRVVQTANNA
jgi:hypothetical protein